MIEAKERLREFEARGLCGKAAFVRNIAPNYLAKAAHNLMVCTILSEFSNNEEAKKLLKIPAGFSAFDWAIVTAYYAMYHGAQAALATISYKSDSHASTVLALEVFFVQQDLLEEKFLGKLKAARELEEKYVRSLRSARKQRETAQYSVSEETGREAAEKLLKDAREFVGRMEKLVADLQIEDEEKE